MFETPDITHITSEDLEHVYEPAEDSFLFLDALQEEYDFLKSRKPTLSLEIGSGSGVVSTFVSNVFKGEIHCLCTDINEKAAQVTRRTAEKNGVPLECVVTDLVHGLLPAVERKVDILLFNPPYVVTPSEEVGSKGIEASWAGGVAGREVIDRLLPLVSRLLSPLGAFYMVLIKENKPDEIGEILAKEGLVMSTVLSRRAGPERLCVVKFVWSGS